MDINLLDAELRGDEGVKYIRYLDSLGVPTTGVGHNLLVSPLPAGWTYPLNDEQVNQLLNHDLKIVFSSLDLHFPWWRKLDEVRQRVIANMCFQMGATRLSGFHHTLAYMAANDYADAAAGMRASEWHKQTPNRAERLARAMETGVMA